MKISAKAEYACLALAELALRHERGQPTSLKVIADKHAISQAFLMQIFLQLKGAKLVQSVRGATGGYQLARPPKQIPLGEIIDVIDGAANESFALGSVPPTPVVRALVDVWRQVRRAERSVLETVTLGDLILLARDGGSGDYQI
ncbi:MAG: Rrf2 family transcriptional regulator [Gemmataceae bacterium]|nr:Rrf2 family transcriptional regulator [Gemmataceae bacterium]